MNPINPDFPNVEAAKGASYTDDHGLIRNTGSQSWNPHTAQVTDPVNPRPPMRPPHLTNSTATDTESTDLYAGPPPIELGDELLNEPAD